MPPHAFTGPHDSTLCLYLSLFLLLLFFSSSLLFFSIAARVKDTVDHSPRSLSRSADRSTRAPLMLFVLPALTNDETSRRGVRRSPALLTDSRYDFFLSRLRELSVERDEAISPRSTRRPVDRRHSLRNGTGGSLRKRRATALHSRTKSLAPKARWREQVSEQEEDLPR